MEILEPRTYLILSSQYYFGSVRLKGSGPFSSSMKQIRELNGLIHCFGRSTDFSKSGIVSLNLSLILSSCHSRSVSPNENFICGGKLLVKPTLEFTSSSCMDSGWQRSDLDSPGS